MLGVDPGSVATGYGVVTESARGLTLVECGVIRTSSKEPLSLRIRQIFDGMNDLIERHGPSTMSVERVFHGRNARSALVLGHARGAILLAAELAGVPISEYAAREIKKVVVGRGGATKDQVAFMVQRHLRLKSAPTPSDAADGAAAAICHFMSAGIPR